MAVSDLMHKLLLAAALERDSDRAVEIFKEHIQLTADILLENDLKG